MTTQHDGARRQPVPVRVSITLPYSVFQALTDRSDQEGRSTSNLGAFLLEQALAQPTPATLPRFR